MTTNADKDPQTHDGTPVDANADKTPAGNVSTVTADTVILDHMKEMFASAKKKSDEQGKLVASLAKHVQTLTAKARSKAPRGTTRARSGRRLDFETPGNRAAHADKASSARCTANCGEPSTSYREQRRRRNRAHRPGYKRPV
ncbi:hypothetical protein F2Q68_00011232 [Brassica cretica]|uniref:Uncharacterized protein n=1 Tax=Brassica cretica TaxID=69181 RepID=A0A8S9KVZ9_BRACR|nr:hypothetical protein F2Q68_00011232 [Brassica cretica]